MAGRAQNEENTEIQAEPPNAMQAHLSAERKRIDAKERRRKALQETAAKLYGQGFERPQIARMLCEHLVPNGLDRPEEQRLSQARARLRKWEHTQDFRDMIYKLAVVKLDLATPAILGGITKKAKRGRVDAARLALEITGRHNPKGDAAPTQVAIVFSGVPRPGRAKAVEAIEINGEDIMVEEDDEV